MSKFATCRTGYSLYTGLCHLCADSNCETCSRLLLSHCTTCETGYTLNPDASCSGNSCDASTAPTNGCVGTCTSSLAHGATCQPTCNSGYIVSGTSSCRAGTLTAATCSDISCDTANCTTTNRGMDYPKIATEWDYLSIPPIVSGTQPRLQTLGVT